MPINFPTKPGIIAYLTAGDPDLATTRDIALAMNFGEAPKRGGRGELGSRYPSTRMGEITQLRQALIDAQEYIKARAEAAKNPPKAVDPADTSARGGGRSCTSTSAAVVGNSLPVRRYHGTPDQRHESMKRRRAQKVSTSESAATSFSLR